MAKRVEIPFFSSYAKGRSEDAVNTLLENMYLEKNSGSGKRNVAAYCHPCLDLLHSTGAGGCRSNGVVWNGKGYFVRGAKLVEVDANFVFTEVGTLNTSTGRCGIASGFNHLMVVDGSDGWTYGPSSGVPSFAKITDVNFPSNATTVAWVDNYFIVDDPAFSGQFRHSELDDATDWDGTDFANAERRSDDIKRLIWFKGNPLMIGEQTSELFYNTGNVNRVFQPYSNGIFEMGTPAPYSASSNKDSLYMIAHSGFGGYQIIRATSTTPQVISFPSLEFEMENMTSVSDAYGFCYEWAGHGFYQIHFPSAGVCYEYGEKTGAWAKRTTKAARYRAGGHLFFNGVHIIGDWENGKFYKLNEGKYTDNGDWVRRAVRTPPLHSSRKLMLMRTLELEIEPGVGNSDKEDPLIGLKFSDDGTATWSNEWYINMGKLGENNRRCIWYKLGSFRERTLEWFGTDPVKYVFLGAHAEIDKGRN
jgi:hypothetical protein|tara:strand:+ start:2370 stop:3794 length:1425 start_codon:yes stop_codon:yes gene_type:complete